MAEVRIEKLLYRGSGLARQEGKVFFVHRAAPGDLAEVRVIESKKDFAVARIERLLESSPDRVDPPCLFFKRGCGGCQWQHLRYETQLEWKGKIFLELLERSGLQPPLAPPAVVPSEPLYYRTRFHFHVERSGKPALFKEHTHELLPIEYCWLLPDSLNTLLGVLLQKPWLKGCRSFQLWIDDRDDGGLETWPPFGPSLLEEIRREAPRLKLLHPSSSDQLEFLIGDVRFQVGWQAFFQTNRFLNKAMNGNVCRMAGEGSALLDLFSGAGFFSLPASRRFTRVVGIEQSEPSARQASSNARLNHIAHAEFVAGPVENYLQATAEGFECVIADPPRAGLSRKTVEWMLASKPERIVYVSCDPATFVRDLCRLAGSYEANEFLLFDLFPQTYHFEVVAGLLRK